jgi:putative flippase GtrA
LTRRATLWEAPGPGQAGTGARVRRFALVGITCGLVQLGLLQVIVEGNVQENLANLAAFALSVQVNFTLSQLYTWRDRRMSTRGPPELVRRLFVFNGAAATTGVVNQGMFGLANLLIWYLPAAALGIAVAAVTNFLLNDRLVFRPLSAQRLATAEGERAGPSAGRARTEPRA